MLRLLQLLHLRLPWESITERRSSAGRVKLKGSDWEPFKLGQSRNCCLLRCCLAQRNKPLKKFLPKKFAEKHKNCGPQSLALDILIHFMLFNSSQWILLLCLTSCSVCTIEKATFIHKKERSFCWSEDSLEPTPFHTRNSASQEGEGEVLFPVAEQFK